MTEAPSPSRSSHSLSREAPWDVVHGFRSWRLWAFFGLNDIRQRYRRSAFGPLWLALGLGATIIGLGLLYSQILRTNANEFIPFLGLSLLVWNLISASMTEATVLFASASGIMNSLKLPLTSFVLRSLTRNVIVFAHCIIPVVIAFLIYGRPIYFTAIFGVLGLLLLVLNLYWIILFTSILCARYRDVAQIVIYAMQIALFITPIIWEPKQLRFGSFFLQANPFFHLVEIVREPILRPTVPWVSFAVAGVMLVVGGAATMVLFRSTRHKLIHWVG